MAKAQDRGALTPPSGAAYIPGGLGVDFNVEFYEAVGVSPPLGCAGEHPTGLPSTTGVRSHYHQQTGGEGGKAGGILMNKANDKHIKSARIPEDRWVAVEPEDGKETHPDLPQGWPMVARTLPNGRIAIHCRQVCVSDHDVTVLSPDEAVGLRVLSPESPVTPEATPEVQEILTRDFYNALAWRMGAVVQWYGFTSDDLNLIFKLDLPVRQTYVVTQLSPGDGVLSIYNPAREHALQVKMNPKD